MANQARLKSYRTTPKYMFGIRVPNDYNEAHMLDEKNGNTKWADAEQVEKDEVNSFETFYSLGKGAAVPAG